MAMDGPFKKMEGELTKPYVLCRIGENDEIIERLAEGESVEDLFKARPADISLRTQSTYPRLNWRTPIRL
jgi:hypothetical protein